MSDNDTAFVQATENLIALYRKLERSTLDLPLLSLTPLLICMWTTLKFVFFLVVGFFLIIPVNLIILIRNLFPGHWRYRLFFLTYIHYAWLWIWRGEAPSGPTIFVRPLLNAFLKMHFERRLRRLRLEMVLNDGLSDATRSALLGRLDAALERWKAPRFGALFYTVVLPAIVAIPTWYKQLIEFLGSLGIQMPTEIVANFVSEKVSTSTMGIVALFSLGYFLAIPVTAFLAKRGLFLGRNPDRICFPGGQGGSGVYSEEREILSAVGLHVREAPVDLWFSGVAIALGYVLVLINWNRYIAWVQSSFDPSADIQTSESQILIQLIVQAGIFAGAFLVAALRRGKTGRL
jgi:hypothetical protein